MRKRFTPLYPVLTILFVIFFGRLQAQTNQSTTILFSSNQQSWINGSAVNNGDRIISVGYFAGSGYVQKPSQGFSGKDSFDAFIICTDEKGNIIWKKIFGSQNSTWCMNIVCDNIGNSYVTGYFENSFSLDGITFSSPGKYNDFLMKLDSNGKVIWGISYAVPYSIFTNNSISPMTCDAGGNLYYVLTFINSVKITSQTFTNKGGYSTMLIKFNTNGNLIWGKIMIGKGNFPALTTDIFGHIYIGGDISKGKTTWGGANLPGVSDTFSIGLFIAKLDANTGGMLWIKRCTGITTYSELTYLNIGNDGTVYAGGYFGDTLMIQSQNFYATPHKYNGYQDGMVVDFDSSGKILWLQHYGNFYEPEYPAGFCMDQNDNIYIGGTYDAPITLGNKILFSTIARDSYVIRFDRYGNYKQSITTNAISNVSVTDISGLMTDGDNKLFMYGGFQSQVNFGGDTLSCVGQQSGFIWEATSSFTAGIQPKTEEMVNIFNVYPNPVNGNRLYIEIENGIPKGSAEISCLDIAGKLLFNETIVLNNVENNNYRIQLPSLKTGLYFIRFITSEGISIQKIIKN